MSSDFHFRVLIRDLLYDVVRVTIMWKIVVLSLGVGLLYGLCFLRMMVLDLRIFGFMGSCINCCFGIVFQCFWYLLYVESREDLYFHFHLFFDPLLLHSTIVFSLSLVSLKLHCYLNLLLPFLLLKNLNFLWSNHRKVTLIY